MHASYFIVGGQCDEYKKIIFIIDISDFFRYNGLEINEGELSE
jgi:hypothetical protein